MEIAEIYAKFDQIGCLTFVTIDEGYPQTRIAQLFAHDPEGLYFRTMITKPFYAQLKQTAKVSICGMYPKTSVSHDKEGMPYFAPGYTIRATGDIREVDFDTLQKKAVEEEMFMLGVKDIQKYPAMTTFCLYRAWGEVYDFDFEMEHRAHKLLRTGFGFGGMPIPERGMRINEACTACGACLENCSFKAIDQKDDRFIIDPVKCDVCGDCFTVCPAEAVDIVIESPLG